MELAKNTASSAAAVLSEDVELTGTLGFTSRLELNGRFEGELIAGGPLVIGETAVVKAQIHSSSSVLILGKFKGNIVAKEKVEVGRQAVLFGDVKTPSFSLAAGAVFVGSADTLEGKKMPADFEQIFKTLGKPARPDKNGTPASMAPETSRTNEPRAAAPVAAA